MQKIKLIFLSLVLLCPAFSKAQGFDELVLQLSQPYSGGSARMLGLGGSKVALGADLGNIYLNAAGLGFYNRSEWSVSPSFNYIGSSTEYLNSSSSDSRFNFNFANAGVVFNRSKGTHNDSEWRGGSFAFSLTRINNFNNNLTYQGSNPNQDIIDYAVEQDNFFQPNAITDLIYGTTLTFEDEIVYEGQETIDINGITYDIEDVFSPSELQPGNTLTFVNRNVYRPDGTLAFPTEEFPVVQREEITTRGAQYAATFAYGGNYDDRIYFGAGVNLMSIDKDIKRVYTESHPNSDLTKVTFTDDYNLTGSGINLNLGLIVRPVETMLVGFSYTSPTYYGMEELREFAMTANFRDVNPISDVQQYVPFYYNLFIPSKIRGGVTYFLGKNGFVSADVESTKIQNAKFSNGDGYSFTDDNRRNQDLFTRTVSASVGGEYRLDMFRFRAGINYITDPTQAEGIDFDKFMYGVGAGIRKKDFFVDLSYNLYQSTQRISPYPTSSQAVANLLNSMATITVGFTM